MNKNIINKNEIIFFIVKYYMKVKIVKYPIDTHGCAPCQINKENNNKKNNAFKTCYSTESLLKIIHIWNQQNKQNSIFIKNKNKKYLWTQIQQKLNHKCQKDEYCWKKQDFIKKLKDEIIDYFTFKPEYPKSWNKNKNTWLNTYDIYYVLKQYE
jgi:hypothetical protein